MQVTVEKKSKKGTSFVSEDRWFNFKRGNKDAPLPRNITEGAVIELTEFDDTGRSVNFTRYDVVSEGSGGASKPAGNSYSKEAQKAKPKSNGYQKDPETQRSIVVQSMVKAAVEACKQGEKADVILNLADKLIAYHDLKVTQGPTKPSKEVASQSKPPAKKKTKAQMAEEQEEPEDMDDEDSPDFDLDM